MAQLTDAELVAELELLEQEEIHMLKEELQNYGPYTNPNYRFLRESLIKQKYEIHKKTGKPVIVSGKRGCVLEGSSRSGKTWGGVDLIICIALFIEKRATINIYRQTYNEFKTTLYDDFKRRLDDFGLDNPFHRSKEIQSFKIKGCTVHFLGDGKHGGGCDYAFFNEGMFISKEVFDQAEMRCRKFWWIDYNPSLTQHWIFNNVIPRPDVGFLRTTFLDNPYISAQEKSKILGREPWESGSYEVTPEGELLYNGEKITDKNQPPPHPENVKNGTADTFYWKVYGLGLRGAMQGVIFPDVEYIDEFPDIAYTYANDFGFTSDPNATVKYAEDEHNIWAELLCYEPVETPEELDDLFEALEFRKGSYNSNGALLGGDLITCDSSDKHVSENKGTIEMVKSLRKKKWQAKKVSKTKSVVYWLLSMKEKKIHIVRNRYYEQAKAEFQNYRWKEVQGIQINQPIDDWNHCFTADTLVLTTDGYKPIVDVVPGDYVVNCYGNHRVLNSFLSRSNAQTYNTEISCGVHSYFISSTKDHKVKTKKGWREIQNIQKGNHLWSIKSTKASVTTFTRESDTSQEVAKDFTELYGKITTGVKYPGATMFTIKTMTLTITALIILLFSQALSISATILKSITGKIKRKLKNTSTRSDQKQVSGMAPKQGKSGTRNTLKGMALETMSTAKGIVKFAVKRLRRKTQVRNSVLTVASHNIVGTRDLIMNLGTASFAGVSLRLTNIPKQKPVLRNVLTSSVQESKREDVYDLTIDTKHEFTANNVVVHNCIDAIRYGHIAHNSKPVVYKTEQTLGELGINY